MEIPNAAPCSAWLSATPSVLPSNLSRTPAAKLGFRGGQLLADLGARVQHRLRQFLDDVKLAELVGNVAKHLGNRLGIQGRTATSNTQLVEKIVRMARELGREVASPDEARQIIGMKP